MRSITARTPPSYNRFLGCSSALLQMLYYDSHPVLWLGAAGRGLTLGLDRSLGVFTPEDTEFTSIFSP